jgi:alkylated DNA repair dioxygenase AlkB
MQQQLFEDAAGPPGFEYRSDFITATEEHRLLDEFARLLFTQVEMRGVVARRRIAQFGWTYGYYSREASAGPPLPEFLGTYRDRAALWAGLAPDRFVEALVTKYPEGAPIGWHRDAPMFGDVIAGISLGASCRMKFRPYVSPAETGGARRTTHEIELAPRSGYLIAGVARQDFEHSIPAVAALRYSITFRTLRDQRRVRR